MHSLSPESPRRAHARRFGRELQKARRLAGIGVHRIEEQLGISRSTLRQYEAGYNLPSLQKGAQLADALGCERLIELLREARTELCANCGGPFVNPGTPQRYCSPRCFEAAQKKRVGLSTAHRADVAERSLAAAERTLDEFRSAVATMCLECEPEGFCRQSECPLRPVSPLPFSQHLRPQLVLRPAPGPWGSEENREKLLAGIRAGNARRWARPGEREAQSERTRERWARSREAAS
jgi:transcriptional regulator with XRE-family HTH domain